MQLVAVAQREAAAQEGGDERSKAEEKRHGLIFA